MKLGKKIRQARKNAGLTQQELANKIGVTQAMVSYYEKDIKKQTIEVTKRIASVLNVSLDELVKD